MLKIYVVDEGWAGGLVVVAESKAEAVQYMLDMDPYDPITEDGLYEYEIEPGEIHRFLGDR
jgi:hypothetical protein